MSRPARSRQPSSRTLALSNPLPLQQYAAQPSPLETLLAERRPIVTKRQRKIADDLYTRAGVITGHQYLHQLTNDVLLHMHIDTTQTFVQGARSLNAMAFQASFLDPETAADVAEWVKADKEMFRRHLAGNLEGAASAVISLSNDALYREEETERPAGILGWLKELVSGGS